MLLETRIEKWKYRTPFRITGYIITDADVLVVTLRDGEFAGQGEANGVYYRSETAESLHRQIEAIRGKVESGLDRAALQSLLPPGGARNALDCALWDIEAKRAHRPVWELADIPQPKPVRTTFTVGVGTPDEMARAAAAYTSAKALKLKLTGEDSAACVRAVRAARPDAWIGVDANQGFTLDSLKALMPALVEAKVSLIEQPLPVGDDAQLEGLNAPIPLAADESIQSRAEIDLLRYYDVLNIKLDKSGGLTEALAMAKAARRLGKKLMVGCMSGTSLAMAPGFVLAQLCDFADLDAPVFFASGREQRAEYGNGEIWCGENIWGGAARTGQE